MKLILSLLFLIVSLNVYAGQWYIVNKDDKSVVATSSLMPDDKDLESRGQIAVFCEEDIPLSQADYKGKKIVLHEKTDKEKTAEETLAKQAEKEVKIQAKMRELAVKALEASGEIVEVK